MTPERLTGLDASFLYMETPTLHMHVAMTAVFDPSTVPGGYSFRRVRQLINDRIPLAPVFQRRLVEVPMRLGHPVWVDDPEFDIDNHLRRAALPSPGRHARAGRLRGRRDQPPAPPRPAAVGDVDRRRARGRQDRTGRPRCTTAPSTASRVPSFWASSSTWSPTRPRRRTLTPRQLDSRIPSGCELVSQAMMASLVAPFDIGRMMLRTTRSIFGVRRIRQGLTAKAALPLTAPRTSINVAVHARRRVAFAAASLADAKKLKNAMGTTVNDVVLAMCAGALRTYLLAGDELPDIPLVSVVPVSVTPDVAELKGSNKVSAMFVQLPCHIDDPLERLQVIHEGTKGAKEEHKALGATTLQNWAEHATPNVFAAAARLYTGMKLADRHRPVANLVVSNVPGPDFPLYLGGSQLLGMFPLGPVMDGMGLNITIMSYLGVLYWGLASDARAVPRLWDIAAAVPHALTELMEAAGLEPEPFDVPIHLGPGMPPTANWIRSAASSADGGDR